MEELTALAWTWNRVVGIWSICREGVADDLLSVKIAAWAHLAGEEHETMARGEARRGDIDMPALEQGVDRNEEKKKREEK